MLHPNILLPAATSLLGFVFAGVLTVRFAQRRQPYYLAWTFGLVWYGLAAGSEALGGALGWNPMLYRTWYATGAIGVAAYLGVGAVYLHREPAFGSFTVVCLMLGSAPALAGGQLAVGFTGLGAAMILTAILNLRRAWLPNAVFVILLVASAAAASIIWTAPVDPSKFPIGVDEVVSGQAFDPATRALTPPFNITGAALLLFGAIASALYFWRMRSDSARVASNVLIAAGAFVPSLGTGLTRFGVTSLFFVAEFLGLACIVAGFLLSGSARSHSR